MDKAILMETHVPVVIAGASLGGVSAALSACRVGCRVLLVGQYSWIGGQLTSQCVPPDENPWVETVGSSASYQRMRRHIRQYYSAFYPLTDRAAADDRLNVGAAFSSPLAHEPHVAHSVLQALLSPYRSSGQLTVITECRIDAVTAHNDRLEAIAFTHCPTDEAYTVYCDVLIDATDTSVVLPMAGAECVAGAEAQRDTNEPSAPLEPSPNAVQAMAVGFVVDHMPGQNHTISKPADYGTWRDHQPTAWKASGAGAQLSWVAPHPRLGRSTRFAFMPNPPGDVHGNATTVGDQVLSEANLWRARRIIARDNFITGHYASDIIVVNWLQNDYVGGDANETGGIRCVDRARMLSLSLLYWMQTEAPRHDGGYGYPGLRPRSDQTGTLDGLAQAPYIRESLRIIAMETICEQDISAEIRGTNGGRLSLDSVGIGAWWMDLHPTSTGDGFVHLPTYPFEIPLGALIPVRMKNLIPACKNIGTTHLTNSAYRVHHVEWAIGEAAGTLAAYASQRDQSLQDIYRNETGSFCSLLDRLGVRRHWDEVIRQTKIV